MQTQINDNDSKQLIEANMDLVMTIARHYQHRGLDLNDLVGEGSMGLIIASKKFDVSRNVPFRAFASSWIKRYIINALSTLTPIQSMSKEETTQLREINRTASRMEGEYERKPSANEIAERTNIPQEIIAEMMRTGVHHRSIDTPLREGNGKTLAEMLSGNNADVDKYKEDIVLALKTLDDREEKVLRSYYGIDEERLTLKEIGDKYDIKRERARQIRDKALRKLKKTRKLI